MICAERKGIGGYFSTLQGEAGDGGRGGEGRLRIQRSHLLRRRVSSISFVSGLGRGEVLSRSSP